VSEWPADYNAELSMRNAMVTAARVMDDWQQGTVPVEVARTQMHLVDVWVRIAQVHATNMQTEAIMQSKWSA